MFGDDDLALLGTINCCSLTAVANVESRSLNYRGSISGIKGTAELGAQSVIFQIGAIVYMVRT